jgi:hypothetical protein
VLLVGFHGGSDPHYVAAYHDHGELIAADVLAPDPGRLEPRALSLVAPGLLWVVDGSQEASAILAFTGAGASYQGPGATVVAYTGVDSPLLHPFDFAFSPDGAWCYVSNQDTNVVARFAVDRARWTLSPAPVARALPSDGTFLTGTFVASANGSLPHVTPTTPVPASHGGLEIAFDSAGKVKHSVRGVAAVGDALYVADEPGDAVKAYDPTGRFLGASDKVKAPVHLLAVQDYLYVSAKEGVFHAQLHAKDPAKLKLHRVLKHPGASGMAFGGTSFYVADRTGGSVSVYRGFSPGTPGKPVTWRVLAPPEFLVHADARGGASAVTDATEA